MSIRCFLPRVCFKMPYKIDILQISLVTLVTLIWFLPSMSPHIHVNEMFFPHYASSYDLLNYLSLWNPCHIALIWFLPRMYFEMFCKITIPWQRLVTLTAILCFFIQNVFQISWKSQFVENTLEDWLHLYAFSPECVLKWHKIWIFYKRT